MSEGKYIKTLDTFTDYNDYLNYLKYRKKYFYIEYIASNIPLINKFFSSWVIMGKIVGIFVFLLMGSSILDSTMHINFDRSLVYLLLPFMIYIFIVSMQVYYIIFNDKYIIKILYILMALFSLSFFMEKVDNSLILIVHILYITIAIYLYTIEPLSNSTPTNQTKPHLS